MITNNGPCYRSDAFQASIGLGLKHKYTPTYRPQTNGKVERFNRRLELEWANATAYQPWIHDDNHHRPHSGIGSTPPIKRVHSVPGSYG